MRTVARVTGACIAASVLTGAVVAGVGTASASPATHTVHLTAVRLQLHQAGHTFAFAEKDLIHGRVVGYDSVNCHYVASANVSHCDIAFARIKGLTYVHIDVDGSGHGTGRITGGTRKYRHASGTVRFVGLSQTRSSFTLHYHG